MCVYMCLYVCVSLPQRLFMYVWFYKKGQYWETPIAGLILIAKARILYKKLYGSSSIYVTDTSDAIKNSKETCFKASSRWNRP